MDGINKKKMIEDDLIKKINELSAKSNVFYENCEKRLRELKERINEQTSLVVNITDTESYNNCIYNYNNLSIEVVEFYENLSVFITKLNYYINVYIDTYNTLVDAKMNNKDVLQKMCEKYDSLKNIVEIKNTLKIKLETLESYKDIIKNINYNIKQKVDLIIMLGK